MIENPESVDMPRLMQLGGKSGMTHSDALKIRAGEFVMCYIDRQEQECRVVGFVTEGPDAPYFRLAGVYEGPVSYRYCWKYGA